ncbi:hypothetical protein [Alteromonas sp. H39]|uniref:hypothetical protein n=1 Tax=Alteromonas sp. H39 TaxID=3389876 RepID=UPI0039DFC619
MSWRVLIIYLLVCIGFLSNVGEILTQNSVKPQWKMPEGPWMQVAGGTEMLLARTRLTVSRNEKAVFLTLGSRDEALIIINGERIGRIPANPEFIQSRFDLTANISPGANTLVIAIIGQSRNIPAMFKAFVESKHPGKDTVTPKQVQWEVAGTAQANHFLRPWGKHLAAVDTWQSPTLVSLPASTTINQSGLPLTTNTASAAGEWFWASDPIDPALELSRSVFVSQGDELYLGVAIDGSYEIRVNQTIAAIYAGHPNVVQYHDLSAFLRRGYNRLDVYLQSKVFQPRAALVGYLYTLDAKTTKDLSTFENWEADSKLLPHGTLADSPPGIRFRPVKHATLNLRAQVTTLLLNAFPLILSVLCCLLIKVFVQGETVKDSVRSVTGVAVVLSLLGWLMIILHHLGWTLPAALHPYLGLICAMLLCIALFTSNDWENRHGPA